MLRSSAYTVPQSPCRSPTSGIWPFWPLRRSCSWPPAPRLDPASRSTQLGTFRHVHAGVGRDACCVAAEGHLRAPPAAASPRGPAGCHCALPSTPQLPHPCNSSSPAGGRLRIVARACPARRLTSFLAFSFAAASAAKAVPPQAPPAAPPPALTSPALTNAAPQPSAAISIRNGCADLGFTPARHDNFRQLHFGGLPSNRTRKGAFKVCSLTLYVPC